MGLNLVKNKHPVKPPHSGGGGVGGTPLDVSVSDDLTVGEIVAALPRGGTLFVNLADNISISQVSLIIGATTTSPFPLWRQGLAENTTTLIPTSLAGLGGAASRSTQFLLSWYSGLGYDEENDQLINGGMGGHSFYTDGTQEDGTAVIRLDLRQDALAYESLFLSVGKSKGGAGRAYFLDGTPVGTHTYYSVAVVTISGKRAFLRLSHNSTASWAGNTDPTPDYTDVFWLDGGGPSGQLPYTWEPSPGFFPTPPWDAQGPVLFKDFATGYLWFAINSTGTILNPQTQTYSGTWRDNVDGVRYSGACVVPDLDLVVIDYATHMSGFAHYFPYLFSSHPLSDTTSGAPHTIHNLKWITDIPTALVAFGGAESALTYNPDLKRIYWVSNNYVMRVNPANWECEWIATFPIPYLNFTARNAYNYNRTNYSSFLQGVSIQSLAEDTASGLYFLPTTVDTGPPVVPLGDDTISGPNYTNSEGMLAFAWDNPGGDYLDADDVQNGTNHHTTGTLTGFDPATAATFDVTTIIQKCFIQNTGIYITTTANTPPFFLGRYGSNKPTLLVNTNLASNISCPITRCSWSNNSTDHAIGDGGEPISLPAWVQFDLRGVYGAAPPGTVILSATMGITWTDIYRNPSVIHMDYIDMPRLVTSPANQLGNVVAGPAGDVAIDTDLASDPAIIFYPDMTSLASIAAAFSAYVEVRPGANSIVSWSDYGLSACRIGSRFLPLLGGEGEGSTLSSWHAYVSDTTSLIADGKYMLTREVQDLYVRYMLKIDPDVAIGFNEPFGLKLPGLGGSGFSARMHMSEVSPANPGIYRLRTYTYDGDNPTANVLGHPAIGAREDYTIACMNEDQIYSIEQRVKQNTRNIDGTYNRDGIYQVWLDGVQVLSITNAFVDNGLDTDIQGGRVPNYVGEFFVNIFHGGGSTPTAQIHFEFGGVAVSESYIGPAKRIT